MFKKSAVMVTIAIFALLVTSATAGFAAATITSKQIKNGTIKGKDVKDDTLTGKQIDEVSLTTVPNSFALGGIPGANFLQGSQLAGRVTLSETATTTNAADDASDSDFIGAVATCPAGTVAIGGSAFTTPTDIFDAAAQAAVNKEVAITDNARAITNDPTKWRVNASETDNITYGWTVSVQAICLG